jgi:hypothetical protein
MTEQRPYDTDLTMSGTNYLGRMAATAVKYATLLGGIYSVCKDEKDLGAAMIFGVGYVLADSVRDTLRETAKVTRLSVLEKKLKK